MRKYVLGTIAYIIPAAKPRIFRDGPRPHDVIILTDVIGTDLLPLHYLIAARGDRNGYTENCWRCAIYIIIIIINIIITSAKEVMFSSTLVSELVC